MSEPSQKCNGCRINKPLTAYRFRSGEVRRKTCRECEATLPSSRSYRPPRERVPASDEDLRIIGHAIMSWSGPVTPGELVPVVGVRVAA